MGLFDKKSASDGADPAEHVTSEATTVVPSQNVSNTELNKEVPLELTVAEKSDTSSQKDMDMEKQQTVPGSASSTGDVEIQNGKAHDDGVLPSGDDEAVYPSGLKLALITLALCLSVFLVALDNTIIATAIPKITDHFRSLGDVGWYGSAYLLTTCALQLFFGKSVTSRRIAVLKKTHC